MTNKCTHRAIRSWCTVDGQPVDMWTCVDCGWMFDPRSDTTERSTNRSADSAESFHKREPVAWMHTNAVGERYFRKKPHDAVFNPQPVYLRPEPLTDEELFYILHNRVDYLWSHIEDCGTESKEITRLIIEFARAIERAHGIGEEE